MENKEGFLKNVDNIFKSYTAPKPAAVFKKILSESEENVLNEFEVTPQRACVILFDNVSDLQCDKYSTYDFKKGLVKAALKEYKDGDSMCIDDLLLNFNKEVVGLIEDIADNGKMLKTITKLTKTEKDEIGLNNIPGILEAVENGYIEKTGIIPNSISDLKFDIEKEIRDKNELNI